MEQTSRTVAVDGRDVGTIAELRAVAVDVAVAAAELVARRRAELFGAGVDTEALVRTKSSDTDPVTVVDTECERFVRRRLAELRPGEPVLGEEGEGSEAGEGAAGVGDPADVAGLRWVVDPIDGTVNFLYGLPAYAVSLAAVLDGESVAGAVVDVVAGVVFSAGLGEGATAAPVSSSEGGSPATTLRVSAATSVSRALVGTGFGYEVARRAVQGVVAGRLLPQVRDLRRGGSSALDLCSVAAGRLDAYYEHGTNPWDWAAGALVAREAGAVVHTPAADALGTTGRLLYAATPGVADDLLRLLRSTGAGEIGPES